MASIGLVVEGHGDAIAAPALIRRIASEVGYFESLDIPKPFRLSRGNIVKKQEIERAVDFMSRKVGPEGVVLVVFDADDDCPVELANSMNKWMEARADINCIVVVAAKEFECWYIASSQELRGVRGLSDAATPPPDPDLVRDGKGWLGRQMPGKYSETLDQAAFASKLNVLSATRSRSFRKFLKELLNIFGVPAPPGFPVL